MGIRLKKRWLSTLDGRTRHAHQLLDGQTQDSGRPFHSILGDIMFPGDPSAAPANIYNCRCTLTAEVEGADMSGGLRRDGDGVLPEMTYAQWEDTKRGAGAIAAAREASDWKQFEEYKNVLGGNAPKSFAEFLELKYNRTEEYESLKGFYLYKGRVPEATKKDYETYLKVKATGVTGSVRIPPEKIDTARLTFRDEHAARHGCTVEDACGYVESAVCSIRNRRWDGESINFFSRDGAAYVDEKTMEIKASYPKEEFKSITKAVLEVFE